MGKRGPFTDEANLVLQEYLPRFNFPFLRGGGAAADDLPAGAGRVGPDRDHLPNPCDIIAGQQQIDNHGRGPQAGQDHLLHAAAWTWIRG